MSASTPGEVPAPVIAPLNCNSIQNVRVNVHFVQYDDGTGNFTAFDDGRPGGAGTAVTGYSYAQDLVGAANGQWDNNYALTIAPGNTLTPAPKRLRLVLTGVYFDRSTRYRGIWGTDYRTGGIGTAGDYPDLTPLCVNKDSVLNIFVQDELAWPFPGVVGSPPPPPGTPIPNRVGPGRGYAYGIPDCSTGPTPSALYMSIASPWSGYSQNQNQGAWQAASLLNHEVAHSLGLDHTWYGASGCADAPANANCWNLNEPAGPDCSTSGQVSNNLMDYNACQCALSPCQIGKIQANLSTCLSRYVVRCSTCLPTYATFNLPASTCGSLTNIWLDGRGTFNNDYFKIEIDQRNARGALIPSSHFEATLWRRVGREQLDALYTFSANYRYRVKLTTNNNCGASAVRVKEMTTAMTAADCMVINPRGTASAPASSTVSTVR